MTSPGATEAGTGRGAVTGHGSSRRVPGLLSTAGLADSEHDAGLGVTSLGDQVRASEFR